MTSSMLDGSGLCGAGWTHEASTRSAHASHAGVAEVWWRGVVCGCAHPTTTERRSTGSCVTLIRSGLDETNSDETNRATATIERLQQSVTGNGRGGKLHVTRIARM